jgi:hypothetical protein
LEQTLGKFSIFTSFLDIDALPAISGIIEQYSSVVAITRQSVAFVAKPLRHERLTFVLV